ncbi:MAG TPA: MBL fold metallo-hydrolase [Jiangellaceae bacterium]
MSVAPDLPAWCRLVRAGNPGPMTLDGTNTYVVLGAAGNVVIDPGPMLEDHLRAVAALGPVTSAVLTHHHLDHSGGARRFHELTGASVLARDPSLCIDGEPLADDDVIVAGDQRLRVLHTPGHTADSICLVTEGPSRVLFTGDTVLGRGTTIVAHPDGSLGAYLASLDRLAALVEGVEVMMLPGHGPAGADAAQAIAAYQAHRRARLDQVRAALESGATSAMDVVRIVYADVDRSVWPAAEATVRAQLDYLGAAESEPGTA